MTPTINLMHLKFFYDAATLQSVSEAAKKNFVTQSAISQGITKLEKILGVEIATHARQGFSLTAEGRVVFEQARHIFKAVRDMQDKVNECQGQVAGVLNFICTNSLGMSFFADAFKNMKNTYPQVSMKFKLGGLHYIRTWLQQGIAEFAIVVYSKAFDQFQKRTLKKGQFHLYQSAKASPSDIENGIFVDDEEGLFVNHLQKLYKKRYRKELKIQAELAGWEVIARFTEKKIGLGFFPDYIVEGNRYPSIKPYPLDIPPIDYEICLVYPKGEKLSHAAEAFIDQIRE